MNENIIHKYIVHCVVIVGIILAFKIWNYFSRKYNNRFLSNSSCEYCGTLLGIKSLNEVNLNWELEKQRLIKVNQKPTIIRSNMILICPNCGKGNFEQELYRRNRIR